VISLERCSASSKSLDERIIPMINIIFLLLLFFMIAGSLSELVREDVVPPRSQSSPVSAAGDAEWLLDRNGTIILPAGEMNLEELTAWLIERENALPRRISLRADARARASALLPLMELLGNYGVKRLSLVTINEEEHQ